MLVLVIYPVRIILNAGLSYVLAAEWWAMFGSSAPTLTKLALRLVSQCASSSGCERNWSTFAFIHTKVRNRLSYKKLHKLVYVNYNLRIQNNLDAGVRSTVDDDPFDRLMELSLNDANNPIREWMEAGRSVGVPELDEETSDSESPLPSHFVSDTVDPSDLRRQTGAPSITEWASKVVGDTHTGKRKHQKFVVSQRSKKPKATKKSKGKSKLPVQSDESTDSPAKSPPYAESNDSSSKTDTDDGDDAGDASGGFAQGGTGTSAQPHVAFTGESQYTHATQDTDHGAPSSQRELIPGTGRQHAYGAPYDYDSTSSCSFGSYGQHPYDQPDHASQPQVKWVYEWQDPQFYEMLLDEWRTTAPWTGRTWTEYKGHLLQTQGIMLMSTEEYQNASIYAPW